MADELLRPDWFLRPQNWPYWTPNTLLGTLPPLARLRYPKNEFEIQGLQQFSGANGQAPGLSNNGRSGPAPAWLDPVSSPTNGGILGSLTRTGDLDQSLSGWAQAPAPLAASAGILAPLARGTGLWGQGVPVWWPSGSHWVGEPGPAKHTRGWCHPYPHLGPHSARTRLPTGKRLPQTQLWMTSYPTPIHRNWWLARAMRKCRRVGAQYPLAGGNQRRAKAFGFSFMLTRTEPCAS
jgi:hypothetical protein